MQFNKCPCPFFQADASQEGYDGALAPLWCWGETFRKALKLCVLMKSTSLAVSLAPHWLIKLKPPPRPFPIQTCWPFVSSPCWFDWLKSVLVLRSIYELGSRKKFNCESASVQSCDKLKFTRLESPTELTCCFSVLILWKAPALLPLAQVWRRIYCCRHYTFEQFMYILIYGIGL